jgi:outer membrane biosynthesis protein TonB
MSAIAHSCASCGNELPIGACFCASCGARATPVGRPVTWASAERRYFGVLPGKRTAIAARTRIGRLLAVFRSRVRLALAVAVARWTEAVERLRLKRQAAGLDRERASQLQALGEAVYRDDQERAAQLRMAIEEHDRRRAAVNEELEAVWRRTNEHIARARIEGGPTNVVPAPEPGPTPPGDPEPPIVPEPEPVPHEPPGPVIVPEPEPVPHEPPGPVIVPEPEPPTGR